MHVMFSNVGKPPRAVRRRRRYRHYPIIMMKLLPQEAVDASESGDVPEDPDVLPDGTLFERWPGYNEMIDVLSQNTFEENAVPLAEEVGLVKECAAWNEPQTDDNTITREAWVRSRIKDVGLQTSVLTALSERKYLTNASDPVVTLVHELLPMNSTMTHWQLMRRYIRGCLRSNTPLPRELFSMTKDRV